MIKQGTYRATAMARRSQKELSCGSKATANRSCKGQTI
jgi:hypothetical protein